MAEIWMFCSAKGGVGKSFVAANLGISISKLRKRVLVVDLDYTSGNLHSCFGMPNSALSVADYFEKGTPLSNLIKKSHFNDCDTIFSASRVTQEFCADYKVVAQLISDLRTLPYDFIFLDTSSSGFQSLFNLQNMVDKTVVLTTPETASVEKTHRWIDHCVEKKVDLENLSLIVNECRTSQQSAVGFSIHALIAKKYGVTCAQVGHLPFDNCAWQASQANQNLFKTFPASTICHEIYRFSKQFIDSEQLRAVS